MLIKIRVFYPIAALFALSFSVSAASAPPSHCHSIGIVPQQSVSELAENWVPLLAWITARSGECLRFATAPDITIFLQRLEAGEYDFAYMNPYQYVRTNKLSGYRAMAREKGRQLNGIIVVNKDSAHQDLGDLNDSLLAFPSRSAFASSIVTQAELRRRGIRFQGRYVASHDSVYYGVARGLFAAGGGIPRTLEMLPEPQRSQLRVLWSSPMYPPHAFAYHPRLEKASVDAILKTLTELEESAEGRALLADIGFRGIEPARDADWDSIRALSIESGNQTGP